MTTSEPSGTLRFGDFELDVAAYELRRSGRPVKLGRQPMDLLILLVQSRRRLVSRSEIIDRLWGKDVFVDVETGVNTAISRIRQVLRDSADAPAFLETVPGKGYRFIADVEIVSTVPASNTSVEPADVARERGLEAAAIAARATAPTVAPPLELRIPAPAVLASRPGWTTRARVVAWLAVLLVVVGIAAFALRQDGPRTSGVTLAVLPFENLGSDPEREYLAAGLTDDTSASLAQVDREHLIVKGRTAPYRGSLKTAGEIGRELAVDYLVESSLRAEGTRLRVTVKLIRVSDQRYVWSHFYDREPTSLLGLQQEVSSDIAEQISLRLSPDRVSGLSRRQTLSGEAYDAYLRGRFQQHRRTADGNANAIGLFKHAIAIDPNYALAWSDLAVTYAGGAINADARPGDVGPLALDAAQHAVRANADLSEAQLAFGYHLWMIGRDWKAAEAALRSAVELDRSNGAAYRTLGHALSQSGRDAEAETAMRRARELDPLDAIAHALSGQVAYQARDVPAAIAHSRRAVVLDPNFWIGYVVLAAAYDAAGDHDRALEALDDAQRLSSNSKILALRGYVLAKMGRVDAAREVLRTFEEKSRERYVPPYAAALVYAGLQDRNAMFEYLEKANAVRDVHLMYLPVDMKWDPYRSDPRFVDLLARCGFISSR